MPYYLGTEPCRVFLTLEETLRSFEEDLAAEQHEVDEQKSSHGKAKQIKQWRTKQGVVQLKAPATTGQAEPNAEDPVYAEVLRDV